MLTYALEERGKEPLYEFLYTKIREDILSGRISRDEPIPSKRALAKHLNISVITVENAYAQLMTEGYIYSKPRSGFYAADISDAVRYLDQCGMKEESHDRQNAGSAGETADTPASVFADFSSNQTQPDSFPFTIWARLSRKVLSEEKQQLMTNPPTEGIRQLREAIAEHLRDFRGMHVSWEQVIVGAGTEYLYGLILQLLGLERIYALEDPGYRKVSQVCEAYGADVRRIPLDAEGLSVTALEASGAQVVHVTPAHHFPTGITMPAKRRYELLRWAAQEPDRYVVEDDYDSEFRLSGRPMPTLFETDTADRVVYMNTFTKTLSSTIRISYMVLPVPLLHRFREKLRFYACTVPTFEQYTLAHFIKEGYFEKHINRMRTLSRKKRDLLLESIQRSALGRIASVSEEHAGLHFLLVLHLNMPEERFLEKLETKGIRFARMSDYESGTPPLRRPGDSTQALSRGEGRSGRVFIMNYSSVPLERIPEAVARICAVLEKQ